MKVASWNVNSVRMRCEHVERFCQDSKVSVLALQETKCAPEDFPKDLLASSHPYRVVLGNKGLSGVAFLSQDPLETVATSLPGEGHQPARFLHVRCQNMELINVYVPNGENLSSDKFAYKERFFKDLICYVREYTHKPLLIMGDFNVAHHVRDVYAPSHFARRLLFSAQERVWLRTLMAQGLFDVLHIALAKAKDTERYTWWDYRNMAYFPEKGLRIDFMLASAKGYDAVASCGVCGLLRQEEKPSDHVPVWCSLKENLCGI